MRILFFWCACLLVGSAWADEVQPDELRPGLELAVDRFPDPPEWGAALPPCAGKTDAPFALEDTFLLHSKPDATKRVYLDFDGHSMPWQGGTWVYPAWNWEGEPETHSDDELAIIQLVWWSVSEDFLPFDIDITTEEPDVEALMNTGGGDVEWGVRAVINHSSYAYSWAYMNSFSSEYDLELFAWSGNFQDIFETWLWTADSVSHEVGHTLGLSDDGTVGVGGYYEGHGEGDVAWSPIMGWTNYGLSQWDRGEYPNANTVGEEDLLIITSQNGFDYRVDDHGSTTDAATVLDLDEAVPVEGIIERTEDLDYFQLTMEEEGQFQALIEPDYLNPNLDIAAVLYDGDGVVLAESNPPTELLAEFDLFLEAGTYFLSVDGTGYDDPNSPGYTDYGSLGYFVVDYTVEYEEDPGDDDTGDDDTGDDDTGDDDPGDDDTGDDDDEQPVESDDDDDPGCGCGAGGVIGPAGPAGLLLLLLVLRCRSGR